MNLKMWLAGIALASAFILSACGGGSSSAGTTVEMLDTFKFNPESITVASGSQVVIKNTGALQHNWVLVNSADASDVANAALANGGSAEGLPGVLAGGKLLNGGQEETLTISVPAGTYQYICTVAGHYQAGMVGNITVQ